MKTLALPHLNKSELEYLRSRIYQKGPDECWTWTGGSNVEGRGQFKKDDHYYTVTRLVYFIKHGVDPGKLLVCHSCDNPACCNPAHFWLGTQKDNVNDCTKKGRKPCGEKNGHATLSENDVKEILKSKDTTNAKLAKRFGVSSVCISNIRRGKRWKHLGGFRQVGRLNSTTGVTGVSPHAGKYQTRITVDGKRRHLGTFDTIEGAAEAVRKARDD